MDKHCKRCDKTLPLSCFQKDTTKRYGVRPECKKCTAERRKENYCVSAVRKNNLNKKFKGKDPVTFYETMFEKQNGKCAICLSKENGHYSNLSIDHNHKTGTLRGLLCNNCNRALGLLKDSQEVLHNAIKYLQKEKQ